MEEVVPTSEGFTHLVFLSTHGKDLHKTQHCTSMGCHTVD